MSGAVQHLSASDWNGRNGQQWLANQMRLDQMLAPFGDAAIAAAMLTMGDHVLDVGCGAGDSSLRIADMVGPDGDVLGIDISQALIGRAHERARASGSRATFRLTDAASDPLDGARFDCLFSRFGVMFFDRPVVALTHLHGLLRPNGRLAFVCWRGAADNDWVSLPLGAIRHIVPPPEPPMPDAPGPFSFGDPARIHHILSSAGFTDIAIMPFDHQIRFGADVADAVQRACDVGPLERALRDCPDDVRARALDAVGDGFARRVTPQGVMIDGAAWIVTASR